MKEKLAKFDKVFYGVVIGTILPIIGFILSFWVKGGLITFERYLDLTLKSSDYQQDILIFCLIPNMLAFYLSNFRWQLYEFTKGLVVVTVVALLALIIITY